MLQRQVDDLDELKASHYQDIMEHEEEVWDFVQGKVGCCIFRKIMHREIVLTFLEDMSGSTVKHGRI